MKGNWKTLVGLALFSLTFSILAMSNSLSGDLNITVRLIFISVFALLSLISLIEAGKLKDKENKNPFKIKKGKHKITNRQIIRAKNSGLYFEFTFKEQHKYIREMGSIHTNKLIGLSSLNIHKNSLRIGWRESTHAEGEFELLAYIYNNGVRDIIPIDIFKIGQEIKGVIYTFKNGKAIIMINGKQYQFWNIGECKWMTFPYFGGNPTCPHDMEFDINYKIL